MRKVLALSFVALLLVSSLPTVSACETEAARIANGQLPSPTRYQAEWRIEFFQIA